MAKMSWLFVYFGWLQRFKWQTLQLLIDLEGLSGMLLSFEQSFIGTKAFDLLVNMMEYN